MDFPTPPPSPSPLAHVRKVKFEVVSFRGLGAFRVISPAKRGALVPTFRREEWIEASEFRDLSEAQVLRGVLERVSASSKPVVLFDLDATLYQMEPRTLQIIKEWSTRPEALAFPEVLEKIAELREEQIGYSVKDTLLTLGFNPTEGMGLRAHNAIKSFWSAHFFTNEWQRWDRPYPGAAEYVSQLHRAGAEIVYLTGRDEERMRAGTEANLVRDGFPWGGRSVQLWMKPTRSVADLAFKSGAVERIRTFGELIASFENEPHNLVAIQDIYPDAMHVFVDTNCSERPSRRIVGGYRIRGYAR